MAYPERKFTDRDLRSEPDLLSKAVAYARDYAGEFEFLVAAQELVIATGTLPLGIARGVLNCMRLDPAVYNDLPQRTVQEHGDVDLYGMDRQPRLYSVPDPPPQPERLLPRDRTYKAEIAERFYVSSVNGQVVHRIVKTVCLWERSKRDASYRYHGPLRPVALQCAPLCKNVAQVKKPNDSWRFWHYVDNPTLFHRAEEAIGLPGKFGPIRKCKSGCFPDQL